MPLIRFLWFSLRPISKAEDVYGWWQLLNILPILSYFAPLVPCIKTAIPFFDSNSGLWFLGVPILLLLIAGVKLQFKKEQYEKRQIELVFDESIYPACKTQFESIQHGIVTCYAVGVRTLGVHSLENVQVILKDIKPAKLDYPVTLHLANSKSGERLKFTVNPSPIPTRYVNILWHYSSTGEVEIEHDEDYNHSIGVQLPSSLANGEYILTLLAHARDVPFCEQQFALGLNKNNDVVFYPCCKKLISC